MDTGQIAEWITDSAYVWGARVQDPASIEVASGSDLEDDKVLPGGLEVARLTWRALGTAGEHAGLLAHIVASSGGGVFAKPYLSLARTTMLGAARALYVLEPDAPADRRARALQLLRTEATDTHKVVGDWEASRATGDQRVQAARAAADQFRTECERELVGDCPGTAPGLPRIRLTPDL